MSKEPLFRRSAPKAKKAQCEAICVSRNLSSFGQRCLKPASDQLKLSDGTLTWLCSPHMGVYIRNNKKK
jgi:hypothetical protein